MTARTPRKPRLLSTLHLLAVMALALWWGHYFYRHTPAREAWRKPDRPDADTTGTLALTLSLDRVAQVVRLVGADLITGCAVVLLFGVGTGVQVRRFEIWLEARTSGQAVAFGAEDLEGQALFANANRERRGP